VTGPDPVMIFRMSVGNAWEILPLIFTAGRCLTLWMNRADEEFVKGYRKNPYRPEIPGSVRQGI